MSGTRVQILKTKEYINKLYPNIKIDFFHQEESDLQQYDIFHNFTMNRDTAEIFAYAKKRGLKTVLSPIYWNSKNFLIDAYGVFAAYFYKFLKKFVGPYSGSILGWGQMMIDNADVILPNSQMEVEIIRKDFKINTSQAIDVVYNAVDEEFMHGDPSLFRETFKIYDDFVLYVGRIDERKNTLRLIKAMNELKDVRLVLIGSYLNKEYYEKCTSEANKNIIFIKEMERKSRMLPSAYAAAKVFVLPSWYETPGLAALEAGIAGANIVITMYGSTKEYFRDYADYVEPSSIKDISSKIASSLNKNKTDKLQTHILTNFTWEKIVRKLASVYDSVVT